MLWIYYQKPIHLKELVFILPISQPEDVIGRYWHSEPEKNILISYIFYPKELKVSDQFILNIISSLAVRDVVASFCNSVKIKWPNDIYVDDKKIAGILVQSILRNADIKASVISWNWTERQ